MTVNNVSNGLAGNFAAIAQEAMETAAQTKAEAAKGDQQAIRKLARTHVAHSPQPASPPAATIEGISRTLNARA